MGADSKEVLVPRGGSDVPPDARARGWQQRDHMKSLGMWVSSDNSTEQDWESVRAAVWRCVHGNLGKDGIGKAPLSLKLRLLNRAAWPVIAFRCARWARTPGRTKAVDRLQNRVVSRLLGLFPFPGESGGHFFQRLHKTANAHCKKMGLWSSFVSARQKAWHSHLKRHPECWPARAIRFRNEMWLQGRRSRYANPGRWGLLAGRTASRAAPGYVFPRWETSLQELGCTPLPGWPDDPCQEPAPWVRG